jgi:hypothetical protein
MDNQLEQLLSDFDLKEESGRKQAYSACIKYANKHLSEAKEFNLFIAAAAKELGQVPIRKDIVKQNIQETGGEKLHLTYSPQNGPVLTGNNQGLLYLSSILSQLAQGNEYGEHTHLYNGEPPMFGNSYSLTIYYEDDSWFWKYANKNTETPEDTTPTRSILPEDIFAFLISDQIPPSMPISANRIYPVKAVHKYEKQSVWIKDIRKNNDRVYVFSFENDHGGRMQLGFDLDDTSLLFFRKEDLDLLKKQI